MPIRKPCQDCNALVPVGTTRCESCEQKRLARRQPRKRAPGESFYKSSQWIAVRDAVIERDGGVCISCGTDQKLSVHHLVPRRQRPDLAYDENNCVTLCWRCHAKADAARRRREA